MLLFARHIKKSSQNKSGVKLVLSNFKSPLGRGALCTVRYCVTDFAEGNLFDSFMSQEPSFSTEKAMTRRESD